MGGRDRKPEGSGGLVRSMAIIGGAQSVNIVIGIVRVKILALLLGPAGIGALGIYGSILQTAAQLAGLGIGQSGVRQIAAARGDARTLSRVRKVLLWANLIQGAAGMAVLWLLRAPISTLVFGDASRGWEVGMLGIGVLLTLISASQTALLQGMRRIGDLARVAIASGVAAAAAGLGAVWALGPEGLIWFLLAPPVMGVLIALRYTRRLPRPEDVPLSAAQAAREWREMAGLGVVFMGGGLLNAATLLAVRSWLTREMGIEAAGHFQASWAITMQYVGFLLSAMGADYYPRLTGIIRDRAASIRLVNDQAQLAMAIGGPVLLALIGLAPWLVELLYSDAFGPAVALLQWQTLGNVFKLAAWPLGFVLIALARSRVYFLTQLAWNLGFLAFMAALTPLIGLPAAGVGFFAAYVLQVALNRAVTGRVHGFAWAPLTVRLTLLHAGLGAALLGLAQAAPLAGAAAGTLAAAVTGVAGLRVVLGKTGTSGRLTRRAARAFALVGWPVRRPPPEAAPDPAPDPEPDPKPGPKPGPNPDPKPGPKPDPKPDPEPRR